MSVRKFSTASILSPSHKGNKLWDQTTFQSGMFAIATVSLTTSASTITFDNIPSNYTHLQVRAMARSTFADTDSFFKLNLNNDTGSNYPNHFLTGNGATVSAIGYSTSQYAYAFLSMYTAANATASIFGTAIIDILDYTNTSKNKTIRSLGGYDVNGAGTARLNSSVWLSTNAVTRIDLTDFRGGSFAANSHFALYGIKAA